MRESYHWRDHLPVPDAAAPDMAAYFSSMLLPGVDRYSFAQPTESYNSAFNNSWRIGYGYTIIGEGGVVRIRNVEPESPAAAAGLQRGDTIVSVDGFSAQQVLAGALPAVTTPAVPRHFVLRDAAGATREVTVRSGSYGVNPLALVKTLDATRAGVPVRVAYMAYHQFAAYSAWRLAIAVDQLAAQGVDELVLDLRYNGGGSVGTSRDLASMISGSRTAGAVYAHLEFGGRPSTAEPDFFFMTDEQRYARALQGLQRVVVLTSGGTASASELLINGLRPFMDVVLVGERTYGKPYGFVPRTDCGMTYSAVNFQAFNARGEGDFAQGMVPTCWAPDDLNHALGDPRERRLGEALAYIEAGRCTAQLPQAAEIAGPRKAPFVLGEGPPPAGMFID